MDIPSDYLNIYTTSSQACQINRIILKHVNRDSIITDATAGIGGNSFYFCKDFKNVNVIEKEPSVIDNLSVNLRKFRNYKIINTSYNIIKFMLKQDVIFIDPPWGGSNYKIKMRVNLYLDGFNVLGIVDDLYNYTNIVCLKVPNNFTSYVDSNFWDHTIYNINKSKKTVYKLIVFYKRT